MRIDLHARSVCKSVAKYLKYFSGYLVLMYMSGADLGVVRSNPLK